MEKKWRKMVKRSDGAFKRETKCFKITCGASRERVNRLLPERTRARERKERKKREKENNDVGPSSRGAADFTPPVTVFFEPQVIIRVISRFFCKRGGPMCIIHCRDRRPVVYLTFLSTTRNYITLYIALLYRIDIYRTLY